MTQAAIKLCRALATGTSLFALAVTITWVAAGAELPTPGSNLAVATPLALVLQLAAVRGLGALTPALVWSIVVDVALAALLGLLLAVRVRRNPHAQQLALALGCFSAGLSLLFIASTFPPFQDWITRRLSSGVAFGFAVVYGFACAAIAFSLLGVGVWMLTRFWLAYPTPADVGVLQDFVRERHEFAQRDGKRLLGSLFPTDETASARAVARSALLLDMDKLHAGALAQSLARKCAAAATTWWSAGVVATMLHLDVARGFGAVAIGGFALAVAAAIFHAPLSSIADVIAFQITSENGANRRRIEWLPVVGAWGHLVTNAFLPFAFLASIPIMFLFPMRADGLFEALLLLSFLLPFTLMPALLVLALGAAVFARGLVDPRLALRKVSLWTLLALIVAFLFMLVERVVALQVVRWLGLPAESGMIIASAAVAITFLPIRHTTEKWVNRFLEQRMPARLLAAGDAQVGAVAIVDITGFTALSAHDEPAALLATTLLQRESRRLSDAVSGRVVKYTGDGAVLVFDHAEEAAATLRQLQSDFARGLDALSLPPLMLHSGAHWGEYVDVRGMDIYGQTVNIASRLADAAAPGEILVSEAFVKALGPHDPAPTPAGARHFKNVPEAVECMRL